MGIIENPIRVTLPIIRKATSNFFSFFKNSSSLSIPPISSSPLQLSLSESLMEESIENAEKMITKWDPNASSYAKITFLLQESREEAEQFIKCVKDLCRAMDFYVTHNLSSKKIVLVQRLIQIAMKRLEKEFYQILSANRQYLDPELVSTQSSKLSYSDSGNSEDEYNVNLDSESRMIGESIFEVERISELAMCNLKSIADCMISSGYGNECLKIYRIVRKSIVHEELYHMGIEQYNSSLVNKMSSEVLDHHVKNWSIVVKIAVKRLFHGEKFLCDHVFSASDAVKESCFSVISNEGAINLFKFPELVVKTKRSPEKIFGLMDLYESISDLFPEIESIFSFESNSDVKSQVLNSLLKIGKTIRSILLEFESSIQKNSSKILVRGGGVHSLTKKTMNFIASLADYCDILSDIIADSTLPRQSYIDGTNSDEIPKSPLSVRLSRIILVLLCKLDGKAELYDDFALSYLFVANNLQFIVEKVQKTKLKYILGEDWIRNHEKKVKLYAAKYELMAWNKVFLSLPRNSNSSTQMSAERVRGYFRQFKLVFEEVYLKQICWVVSDGKLRDEIKISIAKKLVPMYREFYDAHFANMSGEKNLEVLVTFAPDNLGNYLSDLFHGTGAIGNSSLHSRASYITDIYTFYFPFVLVKKQINMLSL